MSEQNTTSTIGQSLDGETRTGRHRNHPLEFAQSNSPASASHRRRPTSASRNFRRGRSWPRPHLSFSDRVRRRQSNLTTGVVNLCREWWPACCPWGRCRCRHRYLPVRRPALSRSPARRCRSGTPRCSSQCHCRTGHSPFCRYSSRRSPPRAGQDLRQRRRRDVAARGTHDRGLPQNGARGTGRNCSAAGAVQNRRQTVSRRRRRPCGLHMWVGSGPSAMRWREHRPAGVPSRWVRNRSGDACGVRSPAMG